MNKLIKILNESGYVECVEFLETDGSVYHFVGLNEEDEEVRIEVTKTNHVYIDGCSRDIRIPFNVWSLREEI
jgi:uncharacterized protein involved in tolerance to divalent cations